MEIFIQQLINGITLGSIYGLIAIGYTMVFGIIGMVNFAHGDVFMVSAFIALIAFLILTTWLGITSIALALFIVLRIVWRRRHPPPAYPAAMPPRQILAVRAGHLLLYVCMVGMPLSGYLASNFSRHGFNFLNRVPLPPWGPDNKALYGILNGTHDVLAILFSILVAGHILLAIYHALIARDGLSTRMSF